jgi:hypothetical protein
VKKDNKYLESIMGAKTLRIARFAVSNMVGLEMASFKEII